MGVFDLYSKRKKRALGGDDDVYTYDKIPEGLRAQVIHVWRDAIGISAPYEHDIQGVYFQIVKILRREYSVFQLVPGQIDRDNPLAAFGELAAWFMSERDTDRVIDAIEISFFAIETICSKFGYASRHQAGQAESIANEAIEELNVRFREHGIGYQYADKTIVRVDSQLIHKEAVVPALTILRGKAFKNAQQEFLSAFEHFRHGKKQEALVDCYKCFESTMKVICAKRKWSFDPKAAAKDLVNVCLSNGLIPQYWQGHFSGLRSVLESAIATPRNKQAGHGAGPGPAPDVPDELVSYVLHMTAATVLFLAEAEKRLQ